MATVTRLTPGAIIHMENSIRWLCSFVLVKCQSCCASARLHFHHFLDVFVFVTYFPRRWLCPRCVFTSPALVVSPEVNADQRRGTLLLPAGLWRAAAGDSLWCDHLQPVWRLLLAQRDRVSIKPQISHTAWVENGDRSLKQATKHTALYLTLNLKVQCANFHFIFKERPTLPLAAEVSCSAVSSCTPSTRWDVLISPSIQLFVGGKYRNNSSTRLTPQTHEQDYVFFSLKIIYVYIPLSNKYLNTQSKDESYRIWY